MTCTVPVPKYFKLCRYRYTLMYRYHESIMLVTTEQCPQKSNAHTEHETVQDCKSQISSVIFRLFASSHFHIGITYTQLIYARLRGLTINFVSTPVSTFGVGVNNCPIHVRAKLRLWRRLHENKNLWGAFIHS
jgi:hypothetical protein